LSAIEPEAATLADPTRSLAARGADRGGSATALAVTHSDGRRGRIVAGLAALIAGFAAIAAIAARGDGAAKAVLLCGMTLVAAIHLWVFVVVRDPRRMSLAAISVVWNVSALGALSALPFAGPLSAATATLLAIVVFVSLGHSPVAAYTTFATTALGHVGITAAVAAGAIADRGRLPIRELSGVEVAVAEALVLGMLATAFGIGRWFRRDQLAAIAELERVARDLGQRDALAELGEVERALRAGRRGRFTGHELGGYQIGDVIGRGAVGEVYAARQSDAAEPVAIKILHDEAADDPLQRARFRREAESVTAIRSPHVVALREVGDDPVPYLVMERLHGTDLASRLRRAPRPEHAEVIRLVADLARGLEAARRVGIVHRDLKPQNVFFDEAMQVWKILDFGVSKLVDGGGTLTRDRIIGTPRYMAPEQATRGEVGHAADVYALAAIAYRCLTGRTPFGGDHVAEVLFQIVHARPARASAIAPVPAAVDAVLAVGLARRPDDRFATATALADALEAALAGKAVAEEPDGAYE
jgi:tRNA A-37 threonylcarbamoyl transferase component Bud32